MNTTTLERIEADISQLSLSEQLLLMERLARRIRDRTFLPQPSRADQLAAMANDPDIQRELQQIEAGYQCVISRR
ncbi:MAG TPA: hypothetical protein VKJ47_18760 [Candidatus Binatia bacterium]|nr:hypothetical protein [Candidatus Binatia bacterium]